MFLKVSLEIKDTTVRHIWKRLANNVRVHDLRQLRKFKFKMAILLFQKSCRFKNNQRYAHLHDDPVNQAVDKMINN